MAQKTCWLICIIYVYMVGICFNVYGLQTNTTLSMNGLVYDSTNVIARATDLPPGDVGAVIPTDPGGTNGYIPGSVIPTVTTTGKGSTMEAEFNNVMIPGFTKPDNIHQSTTSQYRPSTVNTSGTAVSRDSYVTGVSNRPSGHTTGTRTSTTLETTAVGIVTTQGNNAGLMTGPGTNNFVIPQFTSTTEVQFGLVLITRYVIPSISTVKGIQTGVDGDNIATPDVVSSTPSTRGDIEQKQALYQSLFEQYDTRIRPVEDQSRSVIIGSVFVPQAVVELNTQTQVLSIQGYFRFHWNDELIHWDDQADSVGNTIRISTKSLWTPHIKISKNLYREGSVGSRDTDLALIQYSGKVLWYPEGIYSVVCLVDITFYPYDRQRCSFTYYVDDEDASSVQLELLKEDVNLDYYVENAEWRMINVSHELRLADNVYYIDYHFTLERRSEFATFTLVVPAVTISILCVCTFLVPIDSGEKGGVSMTVFLACSVYMTLLVDLLPHNSLTQSNFLIYTIILLFVSVFLICYTIVQAKVSAIYRNQKRVRLSFLKGPTGFGPTLITVLKWLDNIMCGIASVCLVCSYGVLMFAMSN